MAQADEVKLSELGGPESRAPYHLVNAALNLQGSKDPKLRERKTVPMLLGVPLFHALLLGAVVGSTDAAATFMLL